MNIERVVIEAVNNKPFAPRFNSGAVLVDGKWINVKKEIDIHGFKKGESYNLEIDTNAKGYKTIVSIVREKEAVEEAPKKVATSTPIPSIPRTIVEDTPAPGGVSPVAKARDDKDLKVKDTEKMTKADWANKDRSIELQALLKSTLESPMVAQLSVGKKLSDTLEILKSVYEFSLALYDSKK